MPPEQDPVIKTVVTQEPLDDPEHDSNLTEGLLGDRHAGELLLWSAAVALSAAAVGYGLALQHVEAATPLGWDALLAMEQIATPIALGALGGGLTFVMAGIAVFHNVQDEDGESA